MEFFVNALEGNKSLLSLNMANNRLEASIGTLFKTCLEKNKTLIDFEFGFNIFHLEDVSARANHVDPNTPRVPPPEQKEV